MSLVVVDTNIVSYLCKQDTRGALYKPHLLGNEAAISLMTVAELFQWATLRFARLPFNTALCAAMLMPVPSRMAQRS